MFHKITPTGKEILTAAAARCYPQEACGIMIGEDVFEVANVACTPTEFFEMDLEELRALAHLGRPTALWHSHPSGNPAPSTADLEHHPEGMALVIVANGEVYDYGSPSFVS